MYVDDLVGAVASPARLRLGETHRGHLGVAVGHAGDAGLVDRRRVQPGDLLGHEDALLEAAVRELEAGHDVADGEDARHVRTQPLVGQHEAALHRDALLLVPEIRRDRTATDGDQQHIGVERLAAGDGDAYPGLGRLDLLERLAELEVDAALAERALDLLGAVLVLERDQVRQRLDDGHVDAERLPGAGELAADHAAAEDDRGRRQLVEQQRVLGA